MLAARNGKEAVHANSILPTCMFPWKQEQKTEFIFQINLSVCWVCNMFYSDSWLDLLLCMCSHGNAFFVFWPGESKRSNMKPDSIIHTGISKQLNANILRRAQIFVLTNAWTKSKKDGSVQHTWIIWIITAIWNRCSFTCSETETIFTPGGE